MRGRASKRGPFCSANVVVCQLVIYSEGSGGIPPADSRTSMRQELSLRNYYLIIDIIEHDDSGRERGRSSLESIGEEWPL